MRTCYSDISARAIADLVELRGEETPTYLLTRINVPVLNRGRGVARRLVAQVLEDADAEGVTLVLEVVPSDGLGKIELENWYARLGFRIKPGTAKTWERLPPSRRSYGVL